MFYTYDVEFVDEQTGESFLTRREYEKEMDWQEIWDDIMQSGAIQMIPHLMWVEEESENG